MTKRSNHYEAAWEAYLRERRTPYVAVDETRRSVLAGGRSLKSLDFIVSPVGAERGWLVDVKGRQFRTGPRSKQWANWSTDDDVRSLSAWEELFGGPFRGLLVFAYNIVGPYAPLPPDDLFEFRAALYAFVAIRLEHYLSHARPISPRWGTVGMPRARFRQLAAPARLFLAGDPERRPTAAEPALGLA